MDNELSFPEKTIALYLFFLVKQKKQQQIKTHSKKKKTNKAKNKISNQKIDAITN